MKGQIVKKKKEDFLSMQLREEGHSGQGSSSQSLQGLGAA